MRATDNTPTRVWITLFVALVFVCGVSLGFAAGVWLGPRPGGGGFRGPFGPGPDGRRGPPAFVSERIIRELETDPTFTQEQRQQLEALFDERQQEFHTFSREMRSRFEQARMSLRKDVAEILTPSQMEIFDATRRLGPMRRRPDGAHP